MPSFTWGTIEEKTPLPILIRKLNTKLRGLVRDTEMSVEFTISPAPASTGDVLRFNGTTWQNYPTILYSNLPSAASRVWALGGDASFTGGSLTVADFIAASLTADSILVAGTFSASRVGSLNQVTGGDGITTQGLNTVFTANAGTNAGANDNDAAFAWSVGGVEQWRVGVLGATTGSFPAWVLWDSVGATAAIQVDQGTFTVGFAGHVQVPTLDAGTVLAGLWQGSPITETFGGTAQSTYAKGDMLIASAVDTLAKLAVPATDGWVLTFNDTTDLPEWRVAPSASGAPSDAEYIVGAASAGLSAERVGTDTAEIDWDFGTAGQAKLNVLAIAASKITAGTFGAGAYVFPGALTLSVAQPAYKAGTGTRPARFGQALNTRVDVGMNLWYDGANWNLDDVGQPGHLWRSVLANPFAVETATAGANPRTLTTLLTLDTTGQLTLLAGLVATKAALTAGVMTTGQYALNVTATLPSGSASDEYGTSIAVTGAGAGAGGPTALRVDLLSGYTGANMTFGARIVNQSDGTGATIAAANAAIDGVAHGTGVAGAAVINIGQHGQARWASGQNYGLVGLGVNTNGVSTRSGQMSAGVHGRGQSSGGGNVQIGGIFTIGAVDPDVSATGALIADNETTGLDVLLARVNRVTKFKVDGTGIVSALYDASNRLDITVSSAGAVTFNAVGASAGFTIPDPVTVSGLFTASASAVVGTGVTAYGKLAVGNDSSGAVSTALALSNLGASANGTGSKIRFVALRGDETGQDFSYINFIVTDKTVGNEDGKVVLGAMVAGSLVDILTVGGTSTASSFAGALTSTGLLTASASVVIGSPTGGDMGAGTLNADTGIYVDGVAVGGLSQAQVMARRGL